MGKIPSGNRRVSEESIFTDDSRDSRCSELFAGTVSSDLSENTCPSGSKPSMEKSNTPCKRWARRPKEVSKRRRKVKKNKKVKMRRNKRTGEMTRCRNDQHEHELGMMKKSYCYVSK